jgi:hypothetical protein
MSAAMVDVYELFFGPFKYIQGYFKSGLDRLISSPFQLLKMCAREQDRNTRN